MPQIVLFGGECDGHTVPNCGVDRPDVFYAVPLVEEPKVKAIRGKVKRKELQEKLGRLAYKFHRVVSKQGIGLEFQYERAPELDKPTEAPVA
jgi:hypothetical protein